MQVIDQIIFSEILGEIKEQLGRIPGKNTLFFDK
jgi:hypothetical protein